MGLIIAIKNIYAETRNKVKINGDVSDPFWTTNGLRQGCPLSPILFAIYISDSEDVLRRGQDGWVVLGQKNIWSLTFADDIALLAVSQKELKASMARLFNYLDNRDLILNAEK